MNDIYQIFCITFYNIFNGSKMFNVQWFVICRHGCPYVYTWYLHCILRTLTYQIQMCDIYLPQTFKLELLSNVITSRICILQSIAIRVFTMNGQYVRTQFCMALLSSSLAADSNECIRANMNASQQRLLLSIL